MTDDRIQQHQDERGDRRDPPAEPAGGDRSGSTGERRGFDAASSEGSLREQVGVLDEDGEDRRLYTGEPVETEEGWVLPEQQNLAGRDNIAGGGEWPDTDAPPAQPPVDEPRSHGDADEE
jgi:hypothetical protein